jgi:hypothetical protein
MVNRNKQAISVDRAAVDEVDTTASLKHLLETCKATMPAETYTERAVKLLDSQDVINELLEELESCGSLGRVYKGILGIYTFSSKYIDMSYILTEAIPIERALYIHEMTFNQFKVYCKTCDNDVEGKVLFNRVKRICNEIIINDGSVLLEYKYSDSMEHFRRLCSNGMQGVKKAFRGFLMNHTTDIDMDNAHPVILSYICKKNDIKCPYLDYYIQNRKEVLESFPNKTRGDAKSYFLSCINRNVHNINEKHEFYQKWDNETKRLQIALGHINEYKVVRDTVPDDTNFNIKGFQYQNFSITMHIRRQDTTSYPQDKGENATLMYAGCMVYGDHYNNPELLKKITTACEYEVVLQISQY